MFKTLVKNMLYLAKTDLKKKRIEDIIYLTEKVLSDGIYEYGLNVAGYKRLRVLSKSESCQKIYTYNKSFVRFGDGEIRLMWGISQPFQKYEESISRRLMELLETEKDDILVGINLDYFRSLVNDKPGYGREFNRLNCYDFRKFLEEHCNKERVYLDGACTFYEFGAFDGEAERFWNNWKKAFSGKNITVVCGEGILDSLNYSVFSEAMTVNYIYGPRINAWDKHDRIINEIKEKVPKENLLVFILGMAGKAMIPEVTELGYVAWDIGHLAKGYNAYMNRMEASDANIINFFKPD